MGDLAKDIQSRFNHDKIKALINILYTANWLTNKQNAFFKSFDLSPQQYNILRILKGAEKPLKAQTIKERMIERAPNATRLMDKLSAKKLIERKPCDSDRRVVHVQITEKGLALLQTIPSDFNIHLLSKLTNDEAQQLSNLLDKLR
ncbi:MarR family winged helix-turn-helix transcriptional regulator [Bizionia sediminis]|uniref:MarR family winged helix-turn-helix transcriptional regulator n=1 Tax=Bizionia sediminis TaxID=1737064 RepID=A0ABW5KSR8_9FLAO